MSRPAQLLEVSYLTSRLGKLPQHRGMTEILWNTSAPHSPVRDHELVELRLIDLDGRSGHRYVVREIHASWSAAAQQIEWKGFRDRTFESQQEAESSFDVRRDSIENAGFPYRTTLNQSEALRSSLPIL